MVKRRRAWRGLALGSAAWILTLGVGAAAAQPLIQVHEDFSSDPGWEAVNNRYEAIDPQVATQNFTWSRGRVGGTVSQSTTPAWYGMPLDPPLSLEAGFSASGTIQIAPEPRSGVAYLGFFNHERQGWRPWSSMAMRIRHVGDRALIYLDFLTAAWVGGGSEWELAIPTDGRKYTWRFTYDPDATRPEWTDTELESYLTTSRQTLEDLLAKARNQERAVTADRLRERLDEAVEAGLVTYLARANTEFWMLKRPGVAMKGAMRVQFDDGPVYTTYVQEDHHDLPLVMDRFGIFNYQHAYGEIEFYIADLEVNGQKIDLSTNPGWDGQHNRTRFYETNFRPRMDFGYSADTNHAGGASGEVGGQFYGRPHHGHYADEVGELTFDDPIHFSGRFSFVEGCPDAGMFIGYFRAEDREILLEEPKQGGWPQANVLGLRLDGVSRIGWWLTAYAIPGDQDLYRRRPRTDPYGRVLLPTREHRTFTFDYDPDANDGIGRITVTLDDAETFTIDLTPEQREAGGTFNRFGLMSGKAAKYVKLYFDDLNYTARRPPDYQPVHHEQKVIRVPFPRDGLLR